MKLVKPLLVAVLCGLAVGACTDKKNDKKQQRVPVTVLSKHDVEFPQTFVADIQAVQYIEIKPKVEGFVEKIMVDEGKMVPKGRPLFHLEPTEYKEQLKETEANLKQSEAKLKLAEYEYDRIKRLVDKKIISAIRLEQVKAEKEAAEFEVQQAKAKKQQSNTYLSYTNITAPFDGVVDRIPFKVGALVTPNDLLTTLSDISQMFAYFKVNESMYLDIRRSQLSGDSLSSFNEVELILADGTVYDHKGKVETSEGDFETATGSIAFRARFDNHEGLLKHGITGKIRIKESLEDVFVIPQKSTFEIQDLTYVYIVDKEGKVSVKSFTPLSRVGVYYLTQDFEPGTTIVYEGAQLVKEGMTVSCDTVTVEYENLSLIK